MQTLSQKLITKHQWLVHSLYGQKYWDTPFLEEKKTLPNCGNKDGTIINVFKIFISTSVLTVFEVNELSVPIGVLIKLEAHSSLEYHCMLKHKDLY